MSEENIPYLVKEIDDAAEHLLKIVKAGDTVEATDPATLAEKSKAFHEVVTWVEKRAELIPKPKVETKFDRIAGEFSGQTPPRRRGRPSKSNGEDAPTGIEPQSFDA